MTFWERVISTPLVHVDPGLFVNGKAVYRAQSILLLRVVTGCNILFFTLSNLTDIALLLGNILA